MATYERIPRGNLGTKDDRRLTMEKEQECEHRLRVRRQVTNEHGLGICDKIECIVCGAEWRDMGIGQ